MSELDATITNEELRNVPSTASKWILAYWELGSFARILSCRNG